MGIVSSETFFLSDVRSFTDQSEIHHGIDILRAVLKNAESDWFTQHLEDTLKREPMLGFGSSIFENAVCFCEGDDVLTQWRAYAPAGGIAIGFEFDRLYRRAQAGEFAIERMLYDEPKQREIIQRTVESGRNLSRSIEAYINVAKEHEGKAVLDEFTTRVGMLLLRSILLFKHPAFFSEGEWRPFTLARSEDVKVSDAKFRRAVTRLFHISSCHSILRSLLTFAAPLVFGLVRPYMVSIGWRRA